MTARDIGAGAATRCRHFCRAGLLVAAITYALGTPARADEACQLELGEIPVSMVGSRPIATLGINGTQVPMLVDSGAFFSMLTDAAAAQLGLPLRSLPHGMKIDGITGRIDARMTTAKSIQLLQTEIPNLDFIVGGNEMGSGAMGLLGRNILALRDTEYDFAHGMLRLVFPVGDCKRTNLAYWAGETPVVKVPLRYDWSRARPSILVTAQLNGKEIRVLLDTGATSVLSLAAARRAGVAESEMTSIAPVHGAGRGQAEAWTARIKRFELGGETITNFTLPIADFDDDVDMLLGIDFFLSHRIYVANQQRQLYFTYNGGPVFAQDAAAVLAAAAASSAATADEGGPALADAQSYLRRGAAAAARQDHARALTDLDRACAMAPEVADCFVRRGAVHVALKQWPQARQDFDTALRLDTEQHEARLGRAKLRAGSGDRDGALDDLRVLDQKTAVQAHMRHEMALFYLQLDLPHLALAQLDHWIAVRPSDIRLGTALNDRCWARALLNAELDKALDDCNRAIEHAPKNAAFLDSRGLVRLRRGELREAVADYDSALAIRPGAAWSLYGRGIARKRLGEAEGGAADIEAARKLPAIDADAARHGLGMDAGTAPRRP